MCKLHSAAFTLLLALVSFTAQAQMSDRLSEHPTSRKMPSADAVVMTREMTTRFHLNEGQFLQLLPLNRTKLSGLNSINREYRNDETSRTAKTAELEAQYEQECSRILTPSQLSQLQQANNPPAAEPASIGKG